MNVPRIKGSHNAILSGIQAADAVADALAAGRAHDELAAYDRGWRNSPIGRDLWPARNVKPLWARFGTVAGVLAAGIDLVAGKIGVAPFGTLRHRGPDHPALRRAVTAKPTSPAKPDNTLTFDLPSSVHLSGVAHEEDQPVHLHVADMALQKASEHDVYGGPSAYYCPAGVYEWIGEGADLRYQINAANCLHCKACDIKDPNRNITWVPPEGGGGPNYRGM